MYIIFLTKPIARFCQEASFFAFSLLDFRYVRSLKKCANRYRAFSFGNEKCKIGIIKSQNLCFCVCVIKQLYRRCGFLRISGRVALGKGN